MNQALTVSLIGFGEVGQVLAADLRTGAVAGLAAWDVLFAVPDSLPSRALDVTTVRRGASARDAVEGAQFVISAVTAAQDVAAARAAGEGLARGAFFLDLNSVSPDVRKEAAKVIEARRGRYVEAAVMAPITPKRIAAPMLLGGPHAAELLPLLRALGFAGAKVFSNEVGPASAAKMCRSVIVKGMEALLAEAMLAARAYGVEDAVLESLRELFAASDWRKQSRYMISRSLLHGIRRAEEMKEVARTLTSADIEPWMSHACARRQEWAAGHRAAADVETLEAMLDAILESSRAGRKSAQ